MILNLYNFVGANNEINKLLENGITININLKRDFNIINPEIILVAQEDVNFRNFNYCEIPDLERFYFVDSVEQLNNKMFKLHCSCDVLETYKSDILNSSMQYYRNIESGDYSTSGVNLGVGKTISKINSNVTMEIKPNMVMTVVEGGNK